VSDQVRLLQLGQVVGKADLGAVGEQVSSGEVEGERQVAQLASYGV
jgi:hypothetical protein